MLSSASLGISTEYVLEKHLVRCACCQKCTFSKVLERELPAFVTNNRDPAYPNAPVFTEE